MLERTQLRPRERCYVHRPFPARLIDRSTDRETADPDDLETTLLEGANFIRAIEVPQIHFNHGAHSPLDDRTQAKNRRIQCDERERLDNQREAAKASEGSRNPSMPGDCFVRRSR